MAAQSVDPPPLPSDLRPALDAFMSDVSSLLGGYGRSDAAADYVAALLECRTGTRLSATMGGSRSARAESARKFLTRTRWTPLDLTSGLVRRLRGQHARLIFSTQAVTLLGFRDDEPRYNAVAVTVTGEGGWRRETPILWAHDEQVRWMPYERVCALQVHLIGHMAELVPSIEDWRVITWNLLHAGYRVRLDSFGWRYLQRVWPDIGRFTLVRHGTPTIKLTEINRHLRPTHGMPCSRRRIPYEEWIQMPGAVSFNGDVPDWPEVLVARATWSTLTETPSVELFMTNAQPESREMEELLRRSSRHSRFGGQVSLLGAGHYRGPTRDAHARHLALTSAALGFINERASVGCHWGLARERAADREHMNVWLRDSAIIGASIDPGEAADVRRALDPDA